MAQALKGIYNRRHPERTDYYRYMSRAAISVNRVEYNIERGSVVIHEKQDKSPFNTSTTYTIYGQFYREN